MFRLVAKPPLQGEKRKHNSLSIAKKVELLRKLDQGTSVLNICKEYNIGKSTVYDLQKKKDEIMKFFVERDNPSEMKNRKTMHSAKNADIDKVMIEWFRQKRSENVPLTGSILMEQAKRFHESLNLNETCNYSTGWLRNFKKRHGIRQLSICGERASADHEAAENYVDEFGEIVKNENLSPELIYNVDETSLFWRYLPRKSLCSFDEKSPSGIKDCKERITILACANAAGTHKLKLMVIGKFAKPRALKNVNSSALPVIYKANKKAWLTQEITKDWFNNYFIPEARKHCIAAGMSENSKILLVMDNCKAHPPAESLEKENVKVSFLPPNCTSIIQPMDMGVLRALKCRYKSDFVKGLLHYLNSNETVISYVKQFTIKDAIWGIARAWNNITPNILKNSWHNLFPSALFFEDDTDSTFDGFSAEKNNDIVELLEYAKCASSDVQLEEDDLQELMDIDNDAPFTNSLSDSEILNSVLGSHQDEDSQSDSEDDDPQINSRMSIDNLISTMDTAIHELERRSFITEDEIMAMYKIKEKLINEKPKLIKQKTLTEMFKC